MGGGKEGTRPEAVRWTSRRNMVGIFVVITHVEAEQAIDRSPDFRAEEKRGGMPMSYKVPSIL